MFEQLIPYLVLTAIFGPAVFAWIQPLWLWSMATDEDMTFIDYAKECTICHLTPANMHDIDDDEKFLFFLLTLVLLIESAFTAFLIHIGIKAFSFGPMAIIVSILAFGFCVPFVIRKSAWRQKRIEAKKVYETMKRER